MPHPSHRLDLLVVPADPEAEIERAAFERLLESWEATGWIEGDGPGPAVGELLPGGFARVWRDDPGRVVLYANQQGGFRVQCPDTEAIISPAFGAALVAWKHGEQRVLDCPGCGEPHALEDCELRPHGAFGRGAVVFADAASTLLSSNARAALAEALGPVDVVIRRV